MDPSLQHLISNLPEIYQPVYGHPDLFPLASRQCTDRLEKIVQVHDALRRLLGRSLRVLDLGCAQGFFSLSLAERGAIVHGVDFLDKNIAVCDALALEHPNFQASFEVARVENIINKLEAGQCDLVLGLSVFHHLVLEHGVASVRELLDRAGACAGALVVEFALREEPLYWGPAQPKDPRSLLDGLAFVHELARHDTHLAPVPRPLYVASNQYWVLNGMADKFDSWTMEPHALAHGTHQGTRRYYSNADYLVKLFRFDHPRGTHNRMELEQATRFLSNPPAGFPVPASWASGMSDVEGWLVFQKISGKLLLDVLQEGTKTDSVAIVGDILEQLSILEAAGLYHNDIRIWNVLLDADGRAFLIDYGSISPAPIDCAWPDNIYLAFFVFVRELASRVIEHPYPLRTISVSPYNLPEAFRGWAAALWVHPLQEWRFKLLRDSLDTSSNDKQCGGLEKPEDAWVKAIENAIEIQSQAIRQQNQFRIVSDARFFEAETRISEAEAHDSAAEARAVQIDDRLTNAESRAVQLELSISHIIRRLNQTEEHLHSMLYSRSWRITAPLRWLTGAVRRIRQRGTKFFGGEQ